MRLPFIPQGIEKSKRAAPLHDSVQVGNLQRVSELLEGIGTPADSGINTHDCSGYTPLTHAVQSPQARGELVRLLLDHSAEIHQWSEAPYEGNL